MAKKTVASTTGTVARKEVKGHRAFEKANKGKLNMAHAELRTRTGQLKTPKRVKAHTNHTKKHS